MRSTHDEKTSCADQRGCEIHVALGESRSPEGLSDLGKIRDPGREENFTTRYITSDFMILQMMDVDETSLAKISRTKFL